MTRTCFKLLYLGNSVGQCPTVTRAQPCLLTDVSCNGKLLDGACLGEGKGEGETGLLSPAMMKLAT